MLASAAKKHQVEAVVGTNNNVLTKNVVPITIPSIHIQVTVDIKNGTTVVVRYSGVMIVSKNSAIVFIE